MLLASSGTTKKQKTRRLGALYSENVITWIKLMNEEHFGKHWKLNAGESTSQNLLPSQLDSPISLPVVNSLIPLLGLLFLLALLALLTLLTCEMSICLRQLSSVSFIEIEFALAQRDHVARGGIMLLTAA